MSGYSSDVYFPSFSQHLQRGILPQYYYLLSLPDDIIVAYLILKICLYTFTHTFINNGK